MGVGFQPVTESMTEVHRARHRLFGHVAHHELGNPQSALRDLQALREYEPEQVEYIHREIAWLAANGEAAAAIELAERRLESHDDEWRTLELAGEACQARYQELPGELELQVVSS